MPIVWKGVFPALTTKFTAKDELDLKLFEKNLKFQVASGVDGIILGGSLGEASVLAVDEKQRLVEFAVESLSGERPLILNLAEGSQKVAFQQAAYAQSWCAAATHSTLRL